MSAAPIEFFFDFASPYAFLAGLDIDEVASRHGRSVRWRPWMLGAALKVTGSAPNMNIPLKGDYLRRDFARRARARGVSVVMPESAPVLSLAPARAFYVLERDDPERAVPFAKTIWRAHFFDGRDISDRAVVAEIAAGSGLDGAALIASTNDPAIKATLRAVGDEALARGVFGAPFFFVDGEPFWGADRMDDIALWLEKGGW